MRVVAAPAEPLAISLADVEAAGVRLRGVVHRTPVATSQTLDDRLGAHLHLKCENLQRGGSFKVRGAYNRLVQLSDAERARGVVAYSSGNHAQGVALAGRLLGVPVTVAMPSDAPAVKRAATEGYGARIVTYDRSTERREDVAARLAAEGGAVVVPSYDAPAIMAGQGSVALELVEQVPDLDAVVVPLGGGGLLSGVATVIRARVPAARIIGVETEGADDWVQSLAAGHPVRIPPPTTIADGIRTESPGEHTFPVVRALVDDVVVVDDASVLATMRTLLLRTKLLVEPTGAVALAALLTGRVPDVAGRRVGVVLSGGNVDPAVVAAVMAGEGG